MSSCPEKNLSRPGRVLCRIEVGMNPGIPDTVGKKKVKIIRQNLGIPVAWVQQIKVFTLEGPAELLTAERLESLVSGGVLHDPIMQTASLDKPLPLDFAPSPVVGGPALPDWILEVGYRPGVTDNEGRTARDTAALVLGLDREARQELSVYTAVQYRIACDPANPLLLDAVTRIGRDLLCNELIQRMRVKSKTQWQHDPGFVPYAARVSGAASDEVAVIPLSSMSDEELTAFSRENTLALSLEEMHAIRNHFAAPETVSRRAAAGMGADPTDAEIEVLAQTWSEHCKHKIFAAEISYSDEENGTKEVIHGLYKSYIQKVTKDVRARLGDEDFCRSVFTDNAGVVAFNETHDVCIKVETHNSPSALDPYGGALTGIVGVNRDPMGTGMGADLVCNTDVFCFASPFFDGELPPRLLHPRRVLEGVREGVEHGGNKSGVPTINGSILFEERFLGKPLVFCGTVGLIPREVAGRPGYTKKAEVGDAVVMVGGRIGKDGIHGATFSSEELHEESPATAVQIGDPITQRKAYDFIRCARDLGLYNAITDNGAGGLSSSVGEMARDTGGCLLDLAHAPLKYDGLKPWEIFLSEAQERMTLAVPREKLSELLALAAEMDVEATALGTFTDSGFLHVTYGRKNVAFLDMGFLHDGVPKMRLRAVWKKAAERPDPWKPEKPRRGAARLNGKFDGNGLSVPLSGQGPLLKAMLARLNICSKEYAVRQYDHEVKGGSVVKPMIGVHCDGPSDAGVMRPLLDCDSGIVLSHGICPKFSDYDAYWMMANAVDEAVRNAVAVGADPTRLAGVDNFCWCDPVQSERTPDGEHKLAQLVRANKALYDICLAYGLPCVSGKDSMKNDYTGGGRKISIPPTVLFSILGVIPDVTKAQTSDFKRAGDQIYVLGVTKRELGGSEVADELGFTGERKFSVPVVDMQGAYDRYRALYQAIREGFVSACHDLSDGGLGVALAEMAIAGRLGAAVDLALVPTAEELTLTELLYSESASRLLVTVPAEHAERFEALFDKEAVGCIGQVIKNPVLSFLSGGEVVLREDVHDLADAFKSTLNW